MANYVPEQIHFALSGGSSGSKEPLNFSNFVKTLDFLSFFFKKALLLHHLGSKKNSGTTQLKLQTRQLNYE